MKNLIIIIAIFLAASVCYSQTFNAPVAKSSTLATKVITPFSVVDATPSSTPSLPDIIKGQSRDFTDGEAIANKKLFEIRKDADYFVQVDLSCPAVNDGVTLTAHWYFWDTPPANDWDFPTYPLGQSFLWDTHDTDGYISIHVMKIVASLTAPTGSRLFEAKCIGYYYGL